MPLIQGKSKESFGHNVKAEMDAGKPQKQSLAIAYAMKRKAMKKAHGGEVNEKLHPEHEPSGMMSIHDPKMVAMEIMKRKKMAMGGYAEGGEVEHDDDMDMSAEPDWHDPNFLSDEEDSDAINLQYPDPDHKEDTEGMDEKEMKHKLLSKIMMGTHK